MKKIIILILTFLGTLSAKTLPAFAVTFMDDAKDMLRSESEGEENENTDATSRWGQSVRSRNAQDYKRVVRVQPIADSSFAQEANRAPASQSAAGSRGPAALPEQQPVKRASDTKSPPAAVIRAVNKQKAYQESAVIATDQGFFPSTVFVTQGIPVRLFVTGASTKSQCLIMDSFGVRRQIKSQKVEEISFTPETAGTYTFSCPMNGAKGSLVVRELDFGGRVPASATDVSHNEE